MGTTMGTTTTKSNLKTSQNPEGFQSQASSSHSVRFQRTANVLGGTDGNRLSIPTRARPLTSLSLTLRSHEASWRRRYGSVCVCDVSVVVSCRTVAVAITGRTVDMGVTPNYILPSGSLLRRGGRFRRQKREHGCRIELIGSSLGRLRAAQESFLLSLFSRSQKGLRRGGACCVFRP